MYIGLEIPRDIENKFLFITNVFCYLPVDNRIAAFDEKQTALPLLLLNRYFADCYWHSLLPQYRGLIQWRRVMNSVDANDANGHDVFHQLLMRLQQLLLQRRPQPHFVDQHQPNTVVVVGAVACREAICVSVFYIVFSPYDFHCR